jgi:RimJ/RimL family protein N-acetyltransferase
MHKLLLELPTRIETERLYMRPYQAGDGAMLHAVGLRNREHLARYESGNLLNHLEDENHAEIVARQLAVDWLARKHFFLGVFKQDTHQWVGQVYVGPTNWDLPEFTIGYVVDVDHQGLGYITEAVKAALCFIFEHLQAHRVRSDCADTNERSYRVLERCGFTREGHFRQNKRNADGTIHGDYQYGLLKTEFEAINFDCQ